MRDAADRRRADTDRGKSHRPKTTVAGGPGKDTRRARPGRYHCGPVSSLRIGPRPFLNLCRVTLAMVVLNVVTGAAVRLSDSGLGCPDWPTCSQHRLTPALSLHPLVEFGNRVVVVLLVVTSAVTVVASFLRRPARSDLRWLSGGLVARGHRRGRARRVRRLHQAQRLRGHDPLHGGHGPAGRGRAPHPRGRTRTRSGSDGRGRPAPVARPGPGGHDRAGPGGRGGHHRHRSPRRRQGGQAHPARPRGHDPHPRRDRAGHRRPAGGPALGALARATPRPASRTPAGWCWR